MDEKEIELENRKLDALEEIAKHLKSMEDSLFWIKEHVSCSSCDSLSYDDTVNAMIEAQQQADAEREAQEQAMQCKA